MRPSRRRSTRIFAGVAVAALLAAGCGGGEDESPDDAATENGDSDDAGTDGADTDDGGGGEGDGAASGAMEPLDDGFPSDTITVLVVDEPGSSDALYARAVTEAVQEFSPVDLNVIHRDDFGRFGNHAASQWMGDQEGGEDGLVVGVTSEPGASSDLIGAPVIQEIGADMDTFNHVTATEKVSIALYTAVDREWGDSLEDFFAYAQENPGLTYMGGGGGSGRDIAIASYAEQVGFEYEGVAGGSRQEIAAAVAAGEADFAISNPEPIQQFVEDGRIEVLGMTQDGPPVESLGSPPRIHEVTGEEPDVWGRHTGFFVTPETPDEHREWLGDLFQRALESDEFRESRTSSVPGLQIVEGFGHEEFRNIAERGYCEAFPVMEANGLLAPGVDEPIIDCPAD